MDEVHFIMYELKWKSDLREKGGICCTGSEIPLATSSKTYQDFLSVQNSGGKSEEYCREVEQRFSGL